MIKFTIFGGGGRMGKRIISCAHQEDDFSLVGAIEPENSELIGQDSGNLAGIGENGIKITSDPKMAIANADVVIDFSTAQALENILTLCLEKNTPLVVGTTGLDQEQEELLDQISEKLPIVYASNMSVGVNLLFALVRQASAALGQDYDIEIVEAHHRYKKDAPSGTALSLAKAAATARGDDLQENCVYGRKGLTGERPRGQIGIHAIRAGDIVGDHTVYFSNPGERIELIHRAHSRDTLARGALRAARFAAEAKPGLYNMEDVLF